MLGQLRIRTGQGKDSSTLGPYLVHRMSWSPIAGAGARKLRVIALINGRDRIRVDRTDGLELRRSHRLCLAG